MKRLKPQPTPPRAGSEIEVVRLIWLAIFVSVFSFLYYYRNGDVLLYGDAVAHINIARRVFDSKTPGLLQLGTVWLPLPHLLILPCIVSKQMWQSGAGGSIPSMVAFVFGVLGVFRLVRIVLATANATEAAARIAAWAAAIIYAANPNLIYIQATAMGESLYLALFIWAIVFFAEFARGDARGLLKSGCCVAAACLSRYDGWFLAGVLVIAAVVVGFRNPSSQPRKMRKHKDHPPIDSKRVILKFVLLAFAAPALWMAYNAAVYRNPLEFANGPYSAKAIEKKTATVNPARGKLVAAGSYFLKAAELNVAEPKWLGRSWLGLALLGSLAAAFTGRGRVALLLWTPLAFYSLSIAYGSVPIFVPPWWPFSQYNVRYGLQLLPAFAVFVPLGVFFLIQRAAVLNKIKPSWRRWADLAAVAMTLLFAGSGYATIWRAQPICYREAKINARGHVALDRQLGEWIKSLPANATLLMYLGDHVGALERVGIPLEKTINEGNHRVWKQPSDPEGLWDRALADPVAYADYAVGFQGDPVWTAARDQHLTALVEFHATGQPAAVIFQGRAQGGVR
jgi:hypothetical protein